MANYSKRHYRLVSPPSDTAEQIAERIAHREACEKAVKDRLEKFPVLTAENFQEAADYQEARIKFYRGLT